MNGEKTEIPTPLLATRHTRRGVLGIGLGAALLAQSDDQELAMVNLINSYRIENGLSPLVVQAQLQAAAELHSLDQANKQFDGHTGSDGSSAEDRIVRAGYTNWASWSENVAWEPSDGSALTAFVGWQNSPDHNAAMLGDFTDLGVGRAQGPGGWYWTAVFARSW